MKYYLSCQEINLAQKAHKLWSVNGYRNTKYFHLVINWRRAKNRIYAIKQVNAEWCFNQEDLKIMAKNYLVAQYQTV